MASCPTIDQIRSATMNAAPSKELCEYFIPLNETKLIFSSARYVGGLLPNGIPLIALQLSIHSQTHLQLTIHYNFHDVTEAPKSCSA